MLQFYILSDNRALSGFEFEHGLSILIKYKGKTILFDTGTSNLFLQNSEKLRIDIEKADTVVLSHGHFDHGNGLEYLNNKTLICHPGCFIKRYRKADNKYIGLSMQRREIKSKFNLITSKKPYQISNEIIFLGEVPRLNNFEAQSTTFNKEFLVEDFVMDDSGLAIKTGKGLVVVSGCAHAGICNMVEYAKIITGIKQVYAVIGGFHLKFMNKQTKSTIDYFKKEKIQKLFPMHCTSDLVISEIVKEFKNQEVKAGMLVNV